MSWGKKNRESFRQHLSRKAIAVEVMILSIEPEKQRLSLGIKQCQDNPWSSFSQASHKKGDTVEGTDQIHHRFRLCLLASITTQKLMA
jgi:small subunit ribosomal protein S1